MIRKIYWLVAIAMVASVATVPNSIAAEKQFLRFSQWLPPGHWSQRDLMWKWFKEIDKHFDDLLPLPEASRRPKGSAHHPGNTSSPSMASQILVIKSTVIHRGPSR